MHPTPKRQKQTSGNFFPKTDVLLNVPKALKNTPTQLYEWTLWRKYHSRALVENSVVECMKQDLVEALKKEQGGHKDVPMPTFWIPVENKGFQQPIQSFRVRMHSPRDVRVYATVDVRKASDQEIVRSLAEDDTLDIFSHNESTNKQVASVITASAEKEMFEKYLEVDSFLYGMGEERIDVRAALGLAQQYPENAVMVAYTANILDPASPILADKDKDKALQLWERAIKLGLEKKADPYENVFAQNLCGDYYYFESSNETNKLPYYAKALEYYRKATKGSYAIAQFNLATMLSNGWGVSKNNKEAVQLHLHAAKQGNAFSQTHVAKHYEDIRNFGEAVKWYTLASKQNDVNALFCLAVMTKNGNGTTQCNTQALRLFETVAKQGDAEAQYHAAYMYEQGEGVDVDYEQALTLYQKAAKQDHIDAQYRAACILQKGLGTEQNEEEAFVLFQRAADLGHVEAQSSLAELYLDGKRGTEHQNIKMAVQWFSEAAKEGDAYSLYHLGVLYENGKGVLQNTAHAFCCYEKAAKKGFAHAMYNVACFYQEGKFVDRNPHQATRWFREAAKSYESDAKEGQYGAYYDLGTMYESGEGVTQSIADAIDCYKKAEEHGNVDATKALDRLGCERVCFRNNP